MRRRVLLKTLSVVIGILPLRGVRVWAQSVAFPGLHRSTLYELAATVLPESLGRKSTDEIAEMFIRWVVNYRPGAEMQSGYGVTRIRQLPASPALLYRHQLEDLSQTALVPPELRTRRQLLAKTLNAADIRDLMSIPEGKNVVADLMSFYFASSQANDLAYGAAIERDQCRSLQNSEQEPRPLKAGDHANR